MRHITYTTILCLLVVVVSTAELFATSPCAAMAIRLKAPTTTNNHLYAVAYCNQGSEIATNSYIDIEVGPGFALGQATAPLYARRGGVYRFYIGDVDPGACGSLFFEVPHQQHLPPCINTYVIHDNACAPINSELNTLHTSTSDNDSTGNGTSGGNSGTGTDINQANDAMEDLSVSSFTTVSVDPIFEDHVFLNFVPTWDSLISVLGMPPSYNASDATQSQLGASLGIVDYTTLPDYATAKHCSSSATDGAYSNNVYVSTQKEELPSTRIYWLSQPMHQQSTIVVEGPAYQQLRLILVDGAGRQVANIQGIGDRLLVDRQQYKLSAGLYYYLLEGDEKRLSTGLFVAQ